MIVMAIVIVWQFLMDEIGKIIIIIIQYLMLIVIRGRGVDCEAGRGVRRVERQNREKSIKLDLKNQIISNFVIH